MLRWDRTDFLTCLGVEPTTESPGGVSLAYAVVRDGLRLEVRVLPYDAEIRLTLYQGASREPTMALPLTCSEARYRDDNGEYLELTCSGLVTGKVLIWVEPRILITFE